jgi:hypothetical protein
MTQQETAIKQHLAKDRPSAACSCMGPQIIDYEKHGRNYVVYYSIKVTDFGTQPMAVTRLLRTDLGIDLNTVMSAKHSNLFDGPVSCIEVYRSDLARKIRDAGGTVETYDNAPPMEPVCPCAMKMVELVDGIYYQISEIRSLDGIKFKAEIIGPKGGPYKSDISF